MVGWYRPAPKNPHSHLFSHYHPRRERTERAKVRGSMDGHKDSSVSEGKRKRNKCCKGNTYHLLQADWCPVSLWAVTTLRDCLSPKSLPLPQFLLPGMTLHCMEYSIGQFRSVVLAMSLPNLLPVLRVLTAGGRVRKEKVMTLCKHCSTTAKTLVCYQHYFTHKSKIRHHMDC